MAHADYNCCAICDSKMEYSEDAQTKERICLDCLRKLRSLKLDILDVPELLQWIESHSTSEVEIALRSMVFSFCYYPNAVDKLVRAKGIQRDNESRQIAREAELADLRAQLDAMRCPQCGSLSNVIQYEAKVGGSNQAITIRACRDLDACQRRQKGR